MSSADGKSLKSRNMTWLVSLAVLDVAIVAVFVLPGLLTSTSGSVLVIGRAVVTMCLPVVVLLLAGLLSSDLKAILVYWRFTDVLPGHRAFSKHAASDSRIDLGALRKNVGAFPDEPKEQNAMWYRLYKKVGNDPAVVEAHRMFLLYRDMAAVSILLCVLLPGALLINSAEQGSVVAVAAALFVQYVIVAIAGRNSGVRFVTTVLALHAAKRITTPAN